MSIFIKSEKGSIIVLTALLFPVLIGVIGLVLDGGNMLLQKSRLEEATELAGRSALLMSYDRLIWENEGRVVIDTDLAEDSVSQVFQMNYSKGEIKDIKIVDDNQIVLETKVTVEFTFMKIFGFKKKILTSKQMYSLGG